MKILIATDKFKGSLTALQACEAMREGLLMKYPDAEVEMLPLADGGEGTAELLTLGTHGSFIDVVVTGPLFEKVKASYGISGDGRTAFIESAKASGLQLLHDLNRNPMHTTTFGTGELIADAMSRRVQTVLLGIGGTATNDAGIGMANALGFVFRDGSDMPIAPVGKNLSIIERVERPGSPQSLADTKFVALCDVDNPLYGPRGAAHTYGPQKGATPGDVDFLDLGLRNFEVVVKQSLGVDADFAGAGAGGGLASGAKVFLHASIRKAMEYVAEVTQLDKKIMNADLVITGEGKIDPQTLAGKVVKTVALKASLYKKEVIAVCGICELREIEVKKLGISKVITLTDPFTQSQVAMSNARELVIARLSEAWNT